ncbi:MAG: right-handed parallel beta-helix repeat-containing protein [Chthoniobacteraceae bacterium]
MRTASYLEPLEARIAPAAIVFDLPAGNGTPDEITVARDAAQLVLAINGAQVAAWEFAGVDSLGIGGSDDDDTLVVDFDSGEAVPAGGLFFDGRAGFDSLDVRGGSFERAVSTPFDAHSGTLAFDARLITYAGIEPINDTSAAANFVINASSSLDLIVIGNGAVVNGFQTIQVFGGEPANFESVQFANKQVVFINGLGGGDTFNFEATIPAVGLSAILMNGHSSDNAGDDSAIDLVNINGSIAGVAFAVTGGGGADQFFANDGTYNRPITFNGQAGADTLSVSGMTISGSATGALTINDIATITVESSRFTNNGDEGIEITGGGTATLTGVTSTGNLTGLLATGALSISDTGGNYSRNDNHGIQLVGHAGGVMLTDTRLENNDANNDNVGDGFNADTIAGALTVRGAQIRDTGGASDHQERGIFVGSIVGGVTLESSTDNAVRVEGHESDGVRIDNGGATASITGGVFMSNAADGLDLRSFGAITVSSADVNNNQRGLRVENSELTVTGGVFNNHSLHGLSLVTVTATLTDVVAESNASRGIVADLVGASTISGGRFSDNGSHGLELRGNSVVGATIALTDVEAKMNSGDGLLANGFTDSGSAAPEITITGGTFSQNGLAFELISGIHFSANIGDALIENLTAANNPLAGITVDVAASVTMRNVTMSQNGFGASDPLGASFANVGLLSYTPTTGEVDDTFTLSASGRLTTQFTDRLSLGVNVGVLALNGGDGRDTFNVIPLVDTLVVIDGGAPANSPGDVLEYNTERRIPTQSDVGIFAPGVMPVDFSGIESVSINNNGLRLLNAKTAVYRDVDGDDVTLKVNRGAFAFDDFMLDPDGLGAQLQLIVLAGFDRANFTLTAKRSALGGDGFANVGHIDAIDTDLGAISIKGDLGRIDAGTGSATVPAIKSLTVQSVGRLEDTTQATGGSLTSSIFGKLGKLTIRGDMRGIINVAGKDFVSGADGKIGAITIGGSLIGGEALDAGIIFATGNIGTVKIAGSMLGGSAAGSGVIGSGGSIGTVKIGGSLVGGSAPGSGSISVGSSLPIAHHIGSVTIAGDLLGGAGDFSGSILAIAVGRIGNVTIGGSFIAGANPLNGIQSDSTLGAVKIKGDLRGTAAAPAIIAAQGNFNPATPAQALAIKSLNVGGSIEQAQVLAGFKTIVVSTIPTIRLDLVATNPDVQIGPVRAGSWIASSLGAGVTPGADRLFGTADDSRTTPINPGVMDNPDIPSKIASIRIRGQLFGAGSDALGDPFGSGFVAEQIVAMKVGATPIPLTRGAGNDNLTADDPRLTFGFFRDVVVREVA